MKPSFVVVAATLAAVALATQPIAAQNEHLRRALSESEAQPEAAAWTEADEAAALTEDNQENWRGGGGGRWDGGRWGGGGGGRWGGGGGGRWGGGGGGRWGGGGGRWGGGGGGGRWNW